MAADRHLERRAAAGGDPRRFALVEVLPPEPDDLRKLLDQAASGDPAAIAAAERLAETGLGTAVLLDAARHAAARNAAAPTDEPTLAREVFDAYAAPSWRTRDGPRPR